MSKIILYCLLSLLISSSATNLNCRNDCQICDPIDNGTCLRCSNNMWGNNCQYLCQCEDGCDVDTGICYTYILNS